jgi:hypothetical protein
VEPVLHVSRFLYWKDFKVVINPSIFKSSKWKLLTSSEVSVVIALLIRADKTTMMAYPSLETLATDTQTSRMTVFRSIVALEKKTCLTINRSQTFYLKKGHNMIRRKNEYDLSSWARYCHFQKKVGG